MKELKDLPIGVQTFKKMRENNLSNKKIIGIGVNFSHATRQINGWIVKELN